METIKQTVEINAKPAEVYSALTTTEGNRAWWTKNCEVGSKVGATAVFRFENGKVEMRFRIAKLADDEVKLVCVGHENNPDWQDTVLSYRLAGRGDKTRLDLEHAGFREKNKMYEMCVGGWAHFTNSLKSYLESGSGQPHGADDRCGS